MSFHFRPILTIATIISLIILFSLGAWQIQRLQWKEDLIARIEARTAAEPIAVEEAYARWLTGEDMEYTPVYVQAAYQHEQEAHVFGTWDGTVGWYIFTPATPKISIADGRALYINRGFVPHAQKEAATRSDSLIMDDSSKIIGLLRTPQKAPAIAGSLTPRNSVDKNEWHSRDPLAFAASANLDVLPIWIDSSGAESSAEWPLGGTTRVEFNNRHLEYALTWFGLAATLIFVFAAFSLKRD